MTDYKTTRSIGHEYGGTSFSHSHQGSTARGPPQCLLGRGEGFNVSQYSQNTDKTAPNRTENVNDI